MLRLMQTRPEDAGQYTCIVRNAAGEERKMFGLSVLGTCGLCSIQGENPIGLNAFRTQSSNLFTAGIYTYVVFGP